MMDQGLQLRLTQKLALSPQLQQAIRLLQLNRIELREYIQETLESNPILEQAEPGEGTEGGESGEAGDGTEAGAESSETDWETAASEEFSDDPFAADDWGEDSGLGDNWGEPQAFTGDRDANIEDRGSDSLREHLLFQISLGQFNDLDAAIATGIVFALDEDGYLADTTEDIAASLAPEYHVEPNQVEAILQRIQRMEPVGIASRDPAECIRVQLSVLSGSTPELDLAKRIARDFLDFIVAGEYERLAEELGADSERIDTAIDLIRSLEPRPGARYDNRADEYLVPDVYVRHVDGRWVTALSPENDPQLRLNKYYIGLLRKSGGSGDRKYLEGRLQEARWLLSSLELRNRTLLTVSQCIVDAQQGFLEHGEIAMQPLILKEISEEAKVHESTVSRATSRKYLLTPRGLFELKYFFSSHVNTSDGGTVSATSVKARIASLINAEPPGKPLSDQTISALLQDTGIKAARRTVAKYRESLGIGSSSDRRKAWRRLSAGRA